MKFFVLIFFFFFFSPKDSENNETKIAEFGKYISYCTLSYAIPITYNSYSTQLKIFFRRKVGISTRVFFSTRKHLIIYYLLN